MTLNHTLKTCLNSETLDLDSNYRHFCMFSKKTKIVIEGGSHWSTDHRGELYDNFTEQEVNKFILGMQNDKAIWCDGMPPEARKTFVTKDGAEIFTKLFNRIRNRKESPKERKNCINTANL